LGLFYFQKNHPYISRCLTLFISSIHLKTNVMIKITRLWRATAGLLLLFSMVAGSSFAFAAGAADGAGNKPLVWQITGRVTSANGEALPGVAVVVKGSTVGTSTDVNGSYSLSVPETPGTLVFSFIGTVTQERAYTGPGVINVSLVDDTRALQEVVVTGYTTEKKRDIIGSVSVVKPTELLQTPAANLQAQLQGRASGVTVSGSGQPGAGAKVRIRGFASFGNNDPLYVIDGVPTDNPSALNPQDIESIQILKDATAASIYGSRAANGVVIVTTKRGQAGVTRIDIDSYVGVQVIPESTMPEMLNSQQYGEYLFRARNNANLPTKSPIFGDGPNPVVPDFLVVSPSFKGGVSANDPRANPDLYSLDDFNNAYQIIKTSPGTNWHKEITRPAIIQSHQITATGGTEKGNFALGLNYFNQEGTILYTGYDRASVRANTMFNPYKNIRIGENLQLTYEQRQGGSEIGEGGAWAQAFRMVPYLPVYDIMGNFTGNAVGESGNGSNPIANLFRGRNNANFGYRIFGNVFAEVDLLEGLTARTSFGTDYGNNYNTFYTARTFERSENQRNNLYAEQFTYGNTWTWTNTLQYSNTFAEVHNLKVLVGTEAIKGVGRGLWARNNDFVSDSPDFLSIQTGFGIREAENRGVFRNSLYSLFSRLDYTFNDKYLLNATVRRDGSSRFGPEARYGVFPAVGVGWRISGENFMANMTAITDLKLRAGWGQMGSQRNVDAANQYSFYSADVGGSWYPIGGANSSSTPGFRPQREGNLATRWETTETTNIGIDAVLFNGRFNVTLEAYNIETKNLLIQRQPDPLREVVDQPRINIGNMVNRGFDLNMGTTGEFGGGFRYDVNFNFTHYTNKVTRLAQEGQRFLRGASRLGNVVVTEVGLPISSFYGYKLDGFFQDEAELAAGPDMPYKRVGSWRIKDLNNDGKINDEDRTHIGSPIPDFTSGLNLTLGYKNFDLSTFFFMSYGNEIYNFTKWFTDLRGFVGGVSTRVLEDSWTPDNRNASLPILNAADNYSQSISSDFYVEDGSYLRMRTLQLGYKVPESLASRARLSNVRIYLQGQNLFTVTKYSGADPDINIITAPGTPNELQDLAIGLDQANYPTSRQFIIGVNLGF
jgi:TonB-linked SusC/RagA family outer membrane protein